MLFQLLAKIARTFLALLVAVGLPLAAAQKYKVLYAFTGGADGALPIGALTLDSAGNLYGTSAGNWYGDPQSGTTAGSVFKISSDGKFTLLHNFGAGGTGGSWPAAGVVRDAAGNLYGTTSGGGSAHQGTIFKVDSGGNFTILYNFLGGKDGSQPLAALILDPTGNLYGTTYLGGSPKCSLVRDIRCGSVFTLSPNGKEKVLLRFANSSKLGNFPYGPIMRDAAGNLFFTASLGGPEGGGTVLKFGSDSSVTVLHAFSSRSVGIPSSGLIEDKAGNLYGTTDAGVGDIYKIDPQGNETDLYLFGGSRGTSPFQGGVVMDDAGNFYGTTYSGGSNKSCNDYYPGCGVVYKLDPSGNETVLYQLKGKSDGANPQTGVIMDAAGNLYGTAVYGGKVNSNCPAGCGVVFKITP